MDVIGLCFSFLEEQVAGDVSGVCWKLLGALAGVIVSLSLVIVKLARFAWEERASRISDRDDTVAQLRAAVNYAKEKRGGSPP